MKTATRFRIPLSTLAVATILFALSACKEEATLESLQDDPLFSDGLNRFSEGNRNGITLMDWEDIEPTLEGLRELEETERLEFFDSTSTSINYALRYLRGMYYITAENPSAALDEFSRIPAYAIPPVYLYAPYRLHGELKSNDENPFTERILSAANRRLVPNLIAARVIAGKGNFKEALDNYLQSDPGDWEMRDVMIFRSILLHAGLSGATSNIIQAAADGQRLEENVEKELLALIGANADGPTVSEDLKAQFAAFLNESPEALASAQDAIIEQIEVRTNFLEGEYDSLIESYTDTDSIDLANETLLVLVVSAAATGNEIKFEPWAQELVRRFPDMGTESWIQNLRPTIVE